MRLQTASEHNITEGRATVMGAVTSDNNKPAWVLPGGRYTLSEGRATAVAREINRMISRRAATD